MSPSKRYAQKQAKARQRRRRHAHERFERDRRQAQWAAEALHQAIEALGLPADLVAEIEGRLGSQHKLLGKIIGGDVSRALWLSYACGALSCAGLGQALALTSARRIAQTFLAQATLALGAGGPGTALAPCARHEHGPQSRWQWTWVWDDSVFHKDGEQLGWSDGGGVASRNACYRALTGCCCWWLLVMAAWWSQWTLLFDGLLRLGLERRAGTH
jgi:hypothetical protein